MSHENTFDEDKTDIRFLHSEIVRLTEKTAYSLREDEKLTGCVTVKIRYSNFETITRQETIDYTSLDDQLIAKAKDIFDVLVSEYPHAFTRKDIAKIVGLSPRSGTFGKYLSILRNNELMDVEGNKIKASETLFLR